MSAPFRIRRYDTDRDRDAASIDQGFKEYLERLLKMIPGEIVGLYLIGNGFIPVEDARLHLIWIGISLLLLIIVRIYGTRDKANHQPPQFKAILISAVSFLIWVYSLGGAFISYQWHYPVYASLAILVWTFSIPIIYKGSADPE